MPNDDHTVTLDVKLDDWIEKFNTAKGWKRLKAPKPSKLGLRDPEEKFRSSGEERFERKLDALGDPVDLQQKIDTSKQSKVALELRKVQENDADEKLKIDNDIEKLDQDIQDKEAELKLIGMLDKMLKTVQKVEATLPEDLKRQQDRLLELELELEQSTFKISSYTETEDGKNEIAGFIKLHDGVAQNIENARQDVMSVVETGSNGVPVTRNYAAINSKEYKILFGILEEAMLQFRMGKLDDARAAVQKAQDQMWVFRSARTGAEAITPPERFGGDIDKELMLAESAIFSLRAKGYVPAADKHQTALDDLVLKLRGAVNSNATDIVEKFLGEAEALSEACAIDQDHTRQIAKFLSKANQDIQAMQANGHEVHPERVAKRIRDFVAGADLQKAHETAEGIADYAGEQLERTKARDLKKRDIDPVALEQDFNALTTRFGKMFKHEKDGSIRMITDTKSGEKKGVKKNDDLPRETLEEIDLRIKAAEQLMKSDSVDALALAEIYVGNVGIFLDNIENHPKIYAGFADRLKELTKKMSGIEKDYPLYEVAKRADLKFNFEKVKKDYMTKPQAEVVKKLDETQEAFTAFRKEVSGLRSTKRSLAKLADSIEKTIDEVGSVLKKDYEINSAPTVEESKFSGYYGPFRSDLESARAQIAQRTGDTLGAATTALADLKKKVDRGLALLKDYKSKRDKLSPQDILDAKDVMIEAGRGQQKHNADEKDKPTFLKAIEELERQSGLVEGMQKKLRSDPSTREALDSEISGIKDEIKASGAYVEGLERLKPISARMARLLVAASNATEIVDSTLPEAAVKTVKSVNEFMAGVKVFYDKVIHPAATVTTDNGTSNEIDDGAFDEAKIKAYLNSIIAAIPQKALDELADATAQTANKDLAETARRAARKTALAAVRALTAVLEDFKPTAHFRLHSFADVNAVTSYNAARHALPRLEMRLLTAIAD